MSWFPFRIKKSPKSFLGIDIGTSAIRVVELTKQGSGKKLENYGEIKTVSLQAAPFRTIEKDSLLLSNQETAKAISAILTEAGVQSRAANFSIPDYSTFFTNIKLPSMTPKELAQAVRYEARSYVPLPLSEITLDWQVLGSDISTGQKNNSSKILVVAIPNDVIRQYQEIAEQAGLEIKALEAEAFALARAAVRDEKRVTAIVDVGARSTTCNILENGILKMSHSFNISGNELTEVLSRSLGIDYKEADELKKTMGLIQQEESRENARDIFLPLVDLILAEVKKIFQNFYQQEGKEVERIILAGGSSLMPGLREYFFEEFKRETEIPNPFSVLSFPPILDETLREMGPSWAIAVGLALRGLE